MFNGNDIIKDYLIKSGWYSGRSMEKSMIINNIYQEGYQIMDKVISFLQEFWDLTIYFENRRNGIQADDIKFQFEHATHLEVPERINGEYSRRIKKQLCLIGSCYRDHMVLIMDQEGAVYGGYDSFLCKIADNGYSAIEAIILDYQFVEIE